MATCTILRRSTAAVVPLAARRAAVFSSSRTFHSALSVKLLLHKQLTPFVPSRCFSNAVAKNPVEDDNLAQLLQTEIGFALKDHAEKVEIPEEFPFEIEEIIEDNPIVRFPEIEEERTVQLKRQYEDESITVRVKIPTVGPPLKRQCEKNEVSGVVTVFKGNEMCLEFHVTGFPDEVAIDYLYIKKRDESKDQLVIQNEDSEFTDLNENLQKAFLKYLEIRGITPGTFNFLPEYVIKKYNKDYLVWLQNMKSFVEK